jgi:succinate dehydrogenase / fumarate reductase flavoprotein subunit
MHHQFMELADVDITAEPMEVGPTCHYVMGGVEVEPDTAAAAGVPGLFSAGEAAGGMHGSNRLGGNSLSDLLVFGRRAGSGAADYIASLGTDRPRATDADVDAATASALAPFDRTGGEGPYALHAELQQTMNDLVGIIRTASEVEEALQRLAKLKDRVAQVSVTGGRAFNPGWHLALDLQNMVLVSECVARAALMREESRGGHTRDDFPEMSPTWRQVNLICSASRDGTVTVQRQPLPTMPPELLGLFDRSELAKYMTPEELAGLPESTEETH